MDSVIETGEARPAEVAPCWQGAVAQTEIDFPVVEARKAAGPLRES
jgi:hypothetical protein